jgi:hypothetical protein
VIELGDDLAGTAHVPLFKVAPEAVLDHGVQQLTVAHAEPFAHPREQVRRVAHRLHAASDGDVDISRPDGLGGKHDRLQAGSTDLVDRERRHMVGEAAAQSRLTRGILTEPG